LPAAIDGRVWWLRSAEIIRVKDLHSVSKANHDDLIGGLMQRMAGDPLRFLTAAVLHPVEAFAMPRPGFGSGVFLA
jgi:hypothetical protein